MLAFGAPVVAVSPNAMQVYGRAAPRWCLGQGGGTLLLAQHLPTRKRL